MVKNNPFLPHYSYYSSGSNMGVNPYREILEKFKGKKALWRINGEIYEMILEKISPSGWYVELIEPYSSYGKWYKVPQEAVPLEILED